MSKSSITKDLEEFLIKNSIRDPDAEHWIIISLHEDSFYDMLADLEKKIENYDRKIKSK